MKSARAIVIICIMLAWISALGGAWWYLDQAEREIPHMPMPDGGNGILAPGFVHQQGPDLCEPIDGVTSMAFQKLGGVHGFWWSSTFPKLEWRQGAGPIANWEGWPPSRTLPGFELRKFPTEKLPQVSVPFGLYLKELDVTEADLRALAGTPNLSLIEMKHLQLTDKLLKVAREAGLLHAIRVSDSYKLDHPVPRSALDVKTLCLLGAPISDEGVKELAPLKNLTTLSLSGNGVTDAGMNQLVAFKELKSLWLRGTNVTDAGVFTLRQALPKCEVDRW